MQTKFADVAIKWVWLLLLLAVQCRYVGAASDGWIVDAGGTWSDGANWLSGLAPGNVDGTAATDVAFFTNNITADRSISVDSGRTVGGLVFGDADAASPGSWRLAGSLLTVRRNADSLLTVSALGNGKSVQIENTLSVTGAFALTKTGPGTLEIVTGGRLQEPSVACTLAVDEGKLLVSGGVVDMRSPSANDAGATCYIGSGTASSGAVEQTSGSFLVDSCLDFGRLAGTTGSCVLAGGAITVNGENASGHGFMLVGRQGVGSFLQGGGTVAVDRNGTDAYFIGSHAGGVGLHRLTGGSLTVGFAKENYGNIGYVGGGGVGTLEIDGATAEAAFRGLLVGQTAATSTGTVRLANGTLRLGSAGLWKGAGSATFLFDGGMLAPYNSNTVIGSASVASNLTVTLGGSNAVISSSDKDGVGRVVTVYSVLSGGGSLSFVGTGTTVLAATNSYTGCTTVDGGTVQWIVPCLCATNDLRVSEGVTLVFDFAGTNTIRKFYVKGKPQAPGVYGAGTAPSGVSMSGSGFLQVMEVDPQAGTVIYIR